MDDLAGLDRLDWWLNAQRGKRRLLLLWLDAYPLGFALSDVLWASWAFKGDTGWIILGAATVGLLAAIPMVFAISGLHALRVGEMRRKQGKAWGRLSWRSFALRFLVVSLSRSTSSFSPTTSTGGRIRRSSRPSGSRRSSASDALH